MMQRKPGFPVANCSIKMPDCSVVPEALAYEEDSDQQQRRLQLINFGHSQWGFNNWSWSVSKQELDFVDFTNGKYCVGVVAFVSITVKSFDIHRENIGYATSTANSKGFAIYKSRKCAVTNALRETLLSFGGSVATELTELIEGQRADAPANAPEPSSENNQNVANKHTEPRNVTLERAARKEPDSGASPHLRSPLAPLAHPPVQNGPLVQPPVQNGPLVQPPVQNGPLVQPPVQNGPLAPPPIQNGPVAPPPAVKNAARVLASMPPANRPPAPGPAPPAGPGPGPARPPGPAVPPPLARPNSNLPKTIRLENEQMTVEQEPPKMALDGLSEEEARAERKRRQRQAQEEFRLKQLMKQQGLDDKQELGRNSSSFDHLLLEIPTQDIMIDDTGDEPGKRKSPGPEPCSAAKRRHSFKSKSDVVQAD